jgi:hypothetical protein
MEKIHRLVNEVAELCEKEGVPFLLAYGKEKIMVSEYAPETTPELLQKARACLFNSTKRARRQLEIEG